MTFTDRLAQKIRILRTSSGVLAVGPITVHPDNLNLLLEHISCRAVVHVLRHPCEEGYYACGWPTFEGVRICTDPDHPKDNGTLEFVPVCGFKYRPD